MNKYLPEVANAKKLLTAYEVRDRHMKLLRHSPEAASIAIAHQKQTGFKYHAEYWRPSSRTSTLSALKSEFMRVAREAEAEGRNFIDVTDPEQLALLYEFEKNRHEKMHDEAEEKEAKSRFPWRLPYRRWPCLIEQMLENLEYLELRAEKYRENQKLKMRRRRAKMAGRPPAV